MNYLHIMKKIGSNRTWVEESLVTKDSDEDSEPVGNSCSSQALSAASLALLCQGFSNEVHASL